MNRAERRAQESVARKGVHPTQSFQQLVGQANREALKPYIDGQVEMVGSAIRRDIARMVLEENARLQTRLLVLEKILIEKLDETSESLSERILVVEDEATGHIKVSDDEGAKAGDLIRLTFQVRPKEQEKEKFSQSQSVLIHKLATRPNPNVEFQTYKELEEALVGAKAGEEKTVEVTLGGDEGAPGKVYVFKTNIDRISRPVAQEKTEGDNAENTTPQQ